MKIRIYGCRGSLPTPGVETIKYGGNTTCLEVISDSGKVVIIDAGSGLNRLGSDLLSEGSVRDIRFFFTHAHWDHLLGFPFFKPAYRKDYRLTFCSGPHAQSVIKEFLSHQMQAPYFPVNLESLNSEMIFECDNPCAEERFCNCGDLKVKAFPVNHPNGGFGYRIMEKGRMLAFAPDNEISFSHPGDPGRESFVELFKGADLLIHDSQYSDEDYKITRGWGHATFRDAVDLAIEAGVRRLGLFHHDPERSDDQLEIQVEHCHQRIAAAGSDLECFAVADGMELTL